MNTGSRRRGPIVVVVNNHSGRLQPSESFIAQHISRLSQPVVPLIGAPGRRMLPEQAFRAIPGRILPLVAARWLARRIGLVTLAEQDSRATAAFLRESRASAVLAEYGTTAVTVLDACKIARVPLVAHFHGFDAYREDVVAAHTAAYKELFAYSSAIVAVSGDMNRRLVSLGAPAHKIHCNPCGAELPDTAVARPSSSPPHFVAVGRLVEKKAPFLTILAFRTVARRFPDAHLRIIGPGRLMPVCLQVARACGIADRVTLSGAISHGEVLEAMSSARCFVQHSVRAPDGDCEGTPVAVLEAMGMGLPVIATRHGGIADVIDDGSTGLLVDEYDIERMAEAMLRMVEDPQAAARIGHQAREAVLANWTTEASVSRLSEIVERVIGCGRS